jgi:hypothetical protein
MAGTLRTDAQPDLASADAGRAEGLIEYTSPSPSPSAGALIAVPVRKRPTLRPSSG